MATFLRRACFVYLIGGLFLFSRSDGKRTKNKIYVDLQTQNACFRALNGTHQVGCSSGSDGSVGVLHHLEEEEDYTWVMSTGPNPPYVVLISSLNFTSENVDRLLGSGRVNGMLVINLNNSSLPPPPQFSADKACPNEGSGLYRENEKYRSCRNQTWNEGGTREGMFFQDYSIPMFTVPYKDDVDKLIDMCYEKFNRPVGGVAQNYPLCAVQLNGRMDAAKDAETCTRRSNRITNLSDPVRYCDPLGDKNIVGTVKNINSSESRPNNSVIVFATKLDSLSLFHNEYPAADSTITGIVTSLAVAQALSAVQEDIRATRDSKDILFSLFQGESFDYIGSSRMVYDMTHGKFPQSVDSKKITRKQVELGDIHSLVELNQVGLLDQGKLWIHTDPVTLPDLQNRTVLEDMIGSLQSVGSSVGLELGKVEGDAPLPPASVQRFLLERPIPALVITDHERAFTNKYYNSRFDLPGNINVTDDRDTPALSNNETSKQLTKLATTLARFLYTLSTGKNNSDAISASQETVHALLQCFLYNQTCELFRQSVEPDDAKNLEKAKKPFPLYVSVSQNTNQVTTLTHNLLAQFLGTVLNVTKETCKAADGNDKTHQFLWLQGPKNAEKKRVGVCVKSSTLLTPAKSPAFDIDDYAWGSGRYSTWTESVWEPLSVRIFLVPSQQFQTTTLSIGVVILLSSFLIVYFLNAQSDIVFSHPASHRYYTY